MFINEKQRNLVNYFIYYEGEIFMYIILYIFREQEIIKLLRSIFIFGKLIMLKFNMFEVLLYFDNVFQGYQVLIKVFNKFYFELVV